MTLVPAVVQSPNRLHDLAELRDCLGEVGGTLTAMKDSSSLQLPGAIHALVASVIPTPIGSTRPAGGSS